MELVDGLYQMRLLADYGDHRGIEASDLGEAIRQLGAEVASRWRV